ncbi:hypothetical protein AX17_007376 [Amanita inopinata Kibby_2008]|nr:hypothetical protein AX17_007376 [Amanita inopinata Kibby_2008]
MILVWKILLISLIPLLSQLQTANARPTPSNKFISVPLRKVHLRRNPNNEHPGTIYQRHVNRAVRRHAGMTGRSESSLDKLKSDINNHLATIPSRGLEKRYNRGGVADILDILNLGHAKSPPTSGKNKPLEAIASDQASSENVANGAAESPGYDGVTYSQPPNSHNSIGLDIESQDIGYLGVVHIGTPPRPFELLMDSGSADMWVGGEHCRGDDGGSCGNHTFLGPSSSSTYHDLGRKWSIAYGTGAVSGEIVQDSVTVAGLNLPSMKFGVAFNESSDFTPDYIPFDGLVGLAQSKILSRQSTRTLVEALFDAGRISQIITSYKIPRFADGKRDGELTFGGMDPAKYNPTTLVTVKNKSRLGFWEAGIDSVRINGVDTGWRNRTAILDTGTTLILAPKKDVTAIHNAIPGAKLSGKTWTVPCTLNTTLSFTFGGREFSIDPRDIAFLPMDPNNPNGDCMSGISEGNAGPVEFEWLVSNIVLLIPMSFVP